jgi:hypothetical protein
MLRARRLPLRVWCRGGGLEHHAPKSVSGGVRDGVGRSLCGPPPVARAGRGASLSNVASESVGVLGGDRRGEGVGQLVDLLEQVGEDALGFGLAADGGELGGDGAEGIQGAADLDQAIM